LFTILAVILLSVSFTSVSALSPENEKKLNDKLKSLELKIKELVAENTKLKSENAKVKSEITKLKTENTKLKTENTKLKITPADTYALTPSADTKTGHPNAIDTPQMQPIKPKIEVKDYSKITRWDFKDSRANIQGLRIDILSFGWLDSKQDQFSIDMELQQTRGGMWGVYEIIQIKLTTGDNFSYTADKTQFDQLNGPYEQNEKNRAIIKIKDVPKDFIKNNGDVTISITVGNEDEYGYLEKNMFKFDYNLK
ncbi:MAG: cell division protein ZapB, partial [Nitrosopumilus sp.]|nr:cell division protein ZapB [Nitrosopumilus sp.]